MRTSLNVTHFYGKAHKGIFLIPLGMSYPFLHNFAMKTNSEIARELLDYGANYKRFAEKNRRYLDCPYSQRERAKALGALWDAGQKRWYVPNGLDILPFKVWMPKKEPRKSEPTSIGTFLLSIGKKKSSAHLWNGVDTVCRLYSTGGMSKKKKQVTTTAHGRPICSLCLSVNSKRKNPVLFQDVEFAKDRDEFVMQLPNI